MKSDQILIIGRIPPPIGGVTIHIQRLLQHLKLRGVQFSFIELKASTLLKILIAIIKAKKIHLHTSNTYVKVLLTFWARLFNKKLIVTLHGDLFRFPPLKIWLEKAVIKISSFPILLNSKSYREAIKLNKNSQLIGAFIPAVEIISFPENVKEKALSLKNEVSALYCTNASNLNYDKYGKDIYNIENMIDVFNGLSNLGLIISDPSGSYEKYILEKEIQVNKNILLISFPHDFNAVIKLSDTFVRFTTTDGDALSVKEALYLGKSVLATDVVERPKGVILFENNKASLVEKINEIKKEYEGGYSDNSLELLLEIYKR